jgi:Fic family protein
MASLAYNLSNNLQAYLKKIDEYRIDLAILAIPPKDELRLQWESSLERVYWLLLLSEQNISKKQIQEALASSKKKLNSLENRILNHKAGFEYIRQEWEGTTKPINITAFKKLQDIITKKTNLPSTITGGNKSTIERLIAYLENSKEHPVIKAGIAQIQTSFAYSFEDGYFLPGIIPYLFLYKDGYTFRELLVIEEFYRRDLMAFRHARETVRRSENLTLWLEYFAYGVLMQTRKSLKTAQDRKFSTEVPSKFFKLNDRQRGILESLHEPGAKISNKDVKKKYKISQITASRDLSELEDLGLLFKHGKGRSTYYTKV